MSNRRRTTTEDAHRRWRAAGLRVPAVVLATAVTFGGLSAVVDAVASAAPAAATNAPPKKATERERHLQKQAQLDRQDRMRSGKGGTKTADPGHAKHKAKPSGQAKAPDKANSSKKASKTKTKAQAKTA